MAVPVPNTIIAYQLFRDAPDKFVWKGIDLDSVKAGATLPANLDREVTEIYPTDNPGCQTEQ